MKARMLTTWFFLIVLLGITILLPMAYSSKSILATEARMTASPVCKVSYQLNQWTGGFTAQLQVTNNGAALTSWKLTWTFAGDQQITSAWNAQVTQSGTAVSALNTSSNGTVSAGGSILFGFQATFTGNNSVPNNFALNGGSCQDGVTPTVTPSPSTSPTPTATPTPTPISCTGATLCDGFENQSGSTPSGIWQVSYPDCQGTGTVSVDRTVAHTGSTSIRVDGRNGYCNHVFFGIPNAFATVGTDLYVRFFIRHSTLLPVGHVAFAAMRDTNDSSKDLRFGGQNSALQWNRSSDDATLPAQSPVGVALSKPLPVNQWSCVQFEVNEAKGTMSTWLNGSEVQGLHLDGVPTPDIDAQWLSRANWRPALADLRFGWESYSGGDDTLWFDDVAIGSKQVSCS